MSDERKDYRMIVTTQRVLDRTAANVTISVGSRAVGAGMAAASNEDEAIVVAVRDALIRMRKDR